MAYRGLKSDLDILHSEYTPFAGQLQPPHGDSEEDSDIEAPPQRFAEGGGFQRGGRIGGGDGIELLPGIPHRGSGPQSLENDMTPYGYDPGVMIQIVPEAGRSSKWSHIDDLDSFFTKVYEYHQKHGFTVMMLQELLELIQFIFMILFTVFLVECIDYPLLFKDKLPANYNGEKLHLYQIVSLRPFAAMSLLTKAFVLVSTTFWATRFIVVVVHGFQFWDIKAFFNAALKISDADLDSVSWWDVQQRLLAAQAEHMMCIHKEELTELDVYHRILRCDNYLVAMVNKALLPLRFTLPLFGGDYVFLSRGLKYNLELILFRSPWAPFKQWNLRDDYKRVARRKELAESLANQIVILGCINLILMPVILLWQILYSFFNYAEIIKREPGSLGVRKWSLYGKLYLRHLNELDHELTARLARAYKPATYYMDIFVSPLATVIAKNIAFVAGSVLAVLILLTIWDEDVLNVEHVLTFMTVLGACVAGARVFIPDENLVFCPEKTLTQVISHIHYFPVDWKQQAHTYKVMNELGLLFPYTAVYLLDELFSPIITPFILIWHLRYKAQDIVDFFRNFTVSVVGVGDVCSFAQMDVRRHGHPGWQADDPLDASHQQPAEPLAKTNQYTQAEDGKTEMSLVHFALTNPGWKPSHDNEKYLSGLKNCAEKEVQQLSVLPEGSQISNPMYDSVWALSTMGGNYGPLAARAVLGGDGGAVGAPLVPSPPPTSDPSPPSGTLPQDSSHELPRNAVSGSSQVLSGAQRPDHDYAHHRNMNPLMSDSQSLLRSRLGGLPSSRSFLLSGFRSPPSSSSFLNSGLHPPPSYHPDLPGMEYASADMNMSALFLHNIHSKHARTRPGAVEQNVSPRGLTRTGLRGGETEPLLRETDS